MPAPRFGRQIKTEPLCKICSSPKRAEIEDLLALRSKKQSILVDGVETRVTETYIFSIAVQEFGFRLNSANITSHFKKHFQMGDPVSLEASKKERVEQLRERIESGEMERKTPEEFLDLLITLGFEKAELDPNSVTLDHALKAVAEKTKRKIDEGRDTLLQSLGRAVEASVERIPLPAPAPAVDGTPPGEIEAEAVEVEA